MSLPKAVKFKKDGIEYESNFDRCAYTMKELTRAALRDSGKFICRETRKQIKKKTGRGAKNVQYWVRSKQAIPNLQVGLKPGGFYLGFQELGTFKTRKIGALANATQQNIAQIRTIQAQYLSAIENEAQALSMIEEGDYEGE